MDLTEIIIDIAKQGPLVGLLLYLYVTSETKLKAKDDRISELHKEIRDMQVQFFDRLSAMKKDSESVLMAIKDAIKG